MCNARRMTSVLVAASASLRAPWAASLLIKGKINNSPLNIPRSTGYCSHTCSESLPTCCTSRRRTFLTRSSHLQQPRVKDVRRPVTSPTSEAVVSCKDNTILETISSKTSKDVPVPLPVQVSSSAAVLSRKEWMARAEAHRSRVRALTNGSVHHDHNDPIFNFLFEYYHFKPRMLLQWTPGFNVHLQDADPSERGCPLPHKAWEPEPGGGGYYNPLGLDSKRRTQIEWIRNILVETSARAPVFHCFGLHEWAMLYRPLGSEDTRRLYQSLPLRVSQEEINEMVEGKGGAMGCTHFDAFRFFTPEARPLNPIQLDRESQRLHDQPGCIHANMDLFKWALKLWPLLPSEDMADALELAVACRMLDMRASPYDLTAYDRAPDSAVGKGGGKVGGLSPASWDPSPVRIETEEGRKEYQQTQFGLYRRSMPIRRSLVSHVDRLLEVWR